MKKYLLSAAMVVLFLQTFIICRAQDEWVPAAIKESFANRFYDAELIKWSLGRDSYIATIVRNDERLDAYFSDAGDFKGFGRMTTEEFLPLKIQYKLAKEYPEYLVSEVYEFDCTENGPFYYISLKGLKHNLIVRFKPVGDATVMKKAIVVNQELVARRN